MKTRENMVNGYNKFSFRNLDCNCDHSADLESQLAAKRTGYLLALPILIPWPGLNPPNNAS